MNESASSIPSPSTASGIDAPTSNRTHQSSENDPSGRAANPPAASAAGEVRSRNRAVAAFDSAVMLLELHRQIGMQPDFAAMGDMLCNRLAVVVKASRVTLGWITGSACTLQASSSGPVRSLTHDLQTALVAAMDEAIVQQVSLSSINPEGPRRIVAAQRVLATLSSSLVLTVPVAIDETALGALVVELPGLGPVATGHDPAARATSLLRLVERLLAPLARLLQLAWLDRQTMAARWLVRLRTRLRTWRRGQLAPRRMRLALLVAFMMAMVAALIPWQQSITCDARLEGAIERQIAAFDAGYLKSVSVRPGDRVMAGQLLGTLGRREVELELEQIDSGLIQHRSEADAAMAIGDRVKMAAAHAQIDQLTARAQLLELRLSQTEIRAPIAGTILSGDLSRRIDAPVERGETLFTLAPDDALRVIVEVDEIHAQDLFVGQRGQLALGALPWQRFSIEVDRIAPMADVIDNRNVIEARAELQAPPAGLKPGQRGAVHLDGPRQSLARRWLGRLGDSLARGWWRWQPW